MKASALVDDLSKHFLLLPRVGEHETKKSSSSSLDFSIKSYHRAVFSVATEGNYSSVV
jgi:hypothetical protein